MKKPFKKIWELAVPFLLQGKRKDFLLHTKGVIKGMELLLEHERGDENILIPAAIVHDVGWSRVPLSLQKSNEETKKIKALKLHLKYAPPIINEILIKCRYKKSQIKKIISLVLVHKFKKPKTINEKLLIDADTLSDAFKEQFYSDAKEYKKTPEKLYEFRKNNQFYTKTARIIFNKELEKRRKEFSKIKC